MPVTLTPDLMKEYVDLFHACVIVPAKKPEVEAIAKHIIANRSRYETVAQATHVPWHVIGAIHNLESSLDFHTHLHNGDPLTARTVHVPANRPVAGHPPFTWEFSAEDALRYDSLADKPAWTLAETLYRVEGYNGFGYRHRQPSVPSPYLWCWSNQYGKGKYVEDGRFDPNAISNQCGAATVLHYMAATGVITLE